MGQLASAGREPAFPKSLIALAWGTVAAIRLVEVLSRPIMWLDESFYLAEAANLVERGVFPSLSWGPGIALAHAPAYLLLRWHPLALDIAGRVTAFWAGIALYGALYALARAMLGRRWGVYALLLGLAYPPFHHVDNSSVMLYSAALGWAMVAFGSFLKRGDPTPLSLIMIVATGFRSDGMAAFATLSIPVAAIVFGGESGNLRRRIFSTLRRVIVRWFIPYVAAILSLATLAWATAIPDMQTPPGEAPGSFEVLPGSRTYFAFEQGAGIVRRFELEANGLSTWAEGPVIAAGVYGSADSNGRSVIRAVLSNPSAWARRIAWNVRDFLLAWYEAHGLSAAPFAILFFCGLAALWADGKGEHLAFIGAVWAATAPYFLFTFWRRGYMDMLGPVVMLSSLYGLRSVLTGRRTGAGFAIALLAGVALAAAVGFAAWRYMGDPGLSVALAFAIGLLCAPFRPGGRVAKVAGALVLEVTLLLALVTTLGTMYRCVLCAYTPENPDFNYITFASEHYRGERTCSSDPSLAWYARQDVVWMYQIWWMRDLEEVLDAACSLDCEHMLFLTERGAYLDVEAAESSLFDVEFEDDGVVLGRPLCER